MSDLPDLLRIACAQGRMRLNVWFNAAAGHQANLANSGDGWTVHSDRDPLVAIEEVLRVRFGRMLELRRAGRPTAGSVHPAHRERGAQLDIEDAIASAVGNQAMVTHIRPPAVDVEGLIG